MYQPYHDDLLAQSWQAIECSPRGQRTTRHPNPTMVWEHPDIFGAWPFQQHWERQQDVARQHWARVVRARTGPQPGPLRRTLRQVGREWLHAIVVIRSRYARVMERRRRHGTSDIASHSH